MHECAFHLRAKVRQFFKESLCKQVFTRSNKEMMMQIQFPAARIFCHRGSGAENIFFLVFGRLFACCFAGLRQQATPGALLQSTPKARDFRVAPWRI